MTTPKVKKTRKPHKKERNALDAGQSQLHQHFAINGSLYRVVYDCRSDPLASDPIKQIVENSVFVVGPFLETRILNKGR